MAKTEPPPAAAVARLLTVTGRVQGVGFRPFVNRLASRLGLVGWVRNVAGQVEIFAQGTPHGLAAFERLLIDEAPPLARPESVASRREAVRQYAEFTIVASMAGAVPANHIPPDYFLCDDCLGEMLDPTQRRYRYPFINCTQCGPRYTIIDHLPYDRPNTAMAGFALCPACRAEYENPADRRFHAQPLACPRCGPTLRFRCGDEEINANEPAIRACIDALKTGLIVAVKGIGGYHLLCDASREDALLRLRDRKQRPHKPFAVMVPWCGADGLAAARQFSRAQEAELVLLRDPLRPIVLVAANPTSSLAPAVAPDLAEVGLMLPYSPLHHLLLKDFDGPLVATSANLSGEPVLTEPAEVDIRLGRIADAFLHHDRPIRRPADDAVFRRIAGRLRPMRLGRGCAPLEMQLPRRIDKPLLAVGGQMKNSIALAWDDRAVISPHIGDLGSLRSQAVFEQLIAELPSLYGIEPQAVVCDVHPDYSSTRWAQASGLPVIRVYHHHAHASALVGECGDSETTLVFTWDGTGLGEDGSIWGGEALLGRPWHWKRVASWRPFRLTGGDQAIRHPWRTALALLWESGQERWQERDDARLLHQVWRRGIHCPPCSSVGRLFDAASALTELAPEASFEGQAPMLLEAASSDGADPRDLPLAPDSEGLLRTDWAPLLTMLTDARLSVAERGGIFHASLALALTRQAEAVRDRYGIGRVGLTGGVFQNRRLSELAVAFLQNSGFEVWMPKRIPVNDAGLSFGQLIEAMGRRAASSPLAHVPSETGVG